MKPLNRRLRHRIDIEQCVEEIHPLTGARSTQWMSVRDSEEPLIPAEIVPLSGREFVAAQAVQAGVNTRITIRHREGLPAAPSDAAMRAVHRGEIYNIRAVLPDPTLMRHVTLMCEAGVNAG